jgi:hypothetical protein
MTDHEIMQARRHAQDRRAVERRYAAERRRLIDGLISELCAQRCAPSPHAILPGHGSQPENS